MRMAEIDYGYGTARIYGDFTEAEAERAFGRHANQMFGLRKSVMKSDVVATEVIEALPDPWGQMKDATFVLEHNCGGPGWVFKDLAVWNSKGEKIKSEWD